MTGMSFIQSEKPRSHSLFWLGWTWRICFAATFMIESLDLFGKDCILRFHIIILLAVIMYGPVTSNLNTVFRDKVSIGLSKRGRGLIRELWYGSTKQIYIFTEIRKTAKRIAWRIVIAQISNISLLRLTPHLLMLEQSRMRRLPPCRLLERYWLLPKHTPSILRNKTVRDKKIGVSHNVLTSRSSRDMSLEDSECNQDEKCENAWDEEGMWNDG